MTKVLPKRGQANVKENSKLRILNKSENDNSGQPKTSNIKTINVKDRFCKL